MASHGNITIEDYFAIPNIVSIRNDTESRGGTTYYSNCLEMISWARNSRAADISRRIRIDPDLTF